MREQRLSLRQYFTYTGTNEAEWREKSRDAAQERVMRTLVLSEFARREEINVEDAEVHEEMDKIIEGFPEGEQREEARNALSAQDAHREVEDRLFQRKIAERLVGIAEGRIEAAPPEAAPAADDGQEFASGSSTDDEATAEGSEGESETTAEATALEEAGGAAEVLGTGEVDTKSPEETGEAEGGGTPETAPGLEEKG